jgi:hypothetical protein
VNQSQFTLRAYLDTTTKAQKPSNGTDRETSPARSTFDTKTALNWSGFSISIGAVARHDRSRSVAVSRCALTLRRNPVSRRRKEADAAPTQKVPPSASPSSCRPVNLKSSKKNRFLPDELQLRHDNPLDSFNRPCVPKPANIGWN